MLLMTVGLNKIVKSRAVMGERITRCCISAPKVMILHQLNRNLQHNLCVPICTILR